MEYWSTGKTNQYKNVQDSRYQILSTKLQAPNYKYHAKGRQEFQTTIPNDQNRLLFGIFNNPTLPLNAGNYICDWELGFLLELVNSEVQNKA